MTRPRIVYFDLGNVLLPFSHHKAAKQLAAAAGVDEALVWRTVFEGDLEHEFETGQIDAQGFHRRFCELTGSQPGFEAVRHAAADIFEINAPIVPLVAGLMWSGQRLGILSNTNQIHWEHVLRHYAFVAGCFDVHALSFELGSMKPAAEIYARAAELAGVAAGEVFFVDDRQENVAGAQAAGLDAVLYTSVRQLALDLAERGVPSSF